MGGAPSGPERMRFVPLTRWMALHTFMDRRLAKLPAPISLPLAHSPSIRILLLEWLDLIWPSVPTPRWRRLNDPGSGRPFWRLRRLARGGR